MSTPYQLFVLEILAGNEPKQALMTALQKQRDDSLDERGMVMLFADASDASHTESQETALDDLITQLQSTTADNLADLIQLLKQAEHHVMVEAQPLLQDLIRNLASFDSSKMPVSKKNDDSDVIVALLLRKKLNERLFIKTLDTPILNDSIAQHAAWLYNNIYSVHYVASKSFVEVDGIARRLHGISHTARTAIYVPVFANLYRKYGNQEALALTPEDIHLLQIAALLHDAAREGDGKDKWNAESALFIYYYLTRLLSIPKAKAKLIAEAMANKDLSEHGYFELMEHDDGDVVWRYRKQGIPPKNIYAKIIHDVDSGDIMRDVNHFNAELLDFYKDIAVNHPEAFEELAKLIKEIRSLLETQGDLRNNQRLDVKKKYESSCAVVEIKADISRHHYGLLRVLGNQLFSEDELKLKRFVTHRRYDSTKPLDEENMRAAMDTGMLFARAVWPTGKSVKHPHETEVQCELRKVFRRPNVATHSKKDNRLSKHGNPCRCVSMIGSGAGVYGPAGYLIVNPSVAAVHGVSSHNVGRGFGKNATLFLQQSSVTTNHVQALNNLHRTLMKGGSSVVISAEKTFVTTHTDISYDVTRYDAVFYTQDPNYLNLKKTKIPEPLHSRLPLLQAIYLKKQYERSYKIAADNYKKAHGNQVNLREILGEPTISIFEYSGLHDTCYLLPAHTLTEANIIRWWVEMCGDYFRHLIEQHECYKMSSITIEEIKSHWINNEWPLDHVYEPSLKAAINDAIGYERQRILGDYHAIVENKLATCITLFSDSIFFIFMKTITLHDIFKGDLQLKLKLYKQLSSLTEEELCCFDAVSITYEFSQKVPKDFYPRLSKEVSHYFPGISFVDSCHIFSKNLVKALIYTRFFCLQEHAALLQEQAIRWVAREARKIESYVGVVNLEQLQKSMYHFVSLFNIELATRSDMERIVAVINQHTAPIEEAVSRRTFALE